MNIIDVLQRMAYDTKTKLLGKVDKVDGKVLSSNDFSNAYKTKLDGIADGATANVGTITGIKMNGESKGTSGNVDLGTIVTEHQDISGKQDKTDNSLTTTSKEIVGAINEVNSKLITLTAKFDSNGDIPLGENIIEPRFGIQLVVTVRNTMNGNISTHWYNKNKRKFVYVSGEKSTTGSANIQYFV